MTVTPLSPREVEVLTLSAEGRTMVSAARYLGTSLKTVKAQHGSAKVKLQAVSMANAIAIAIKHGLIEPEV